MSGRIVALNEEELGLLKALLTTLVHPAAKLLSEKLDDNNAPLDGMLSLSFGHVSLQTINWLDARAKEMSKGKPHHHVARTAFGYFVYCDEENGSGDIPPDLFECMTKARDLGASYIQFADELEPNYYLDLPVYDEMPSKITVGELTASKITIRCSHCGSSNVLKDAYAGWSDEAQDWALRSVYDADVCDDCGREDVAKEFPLTEET